jgi:hypothetical protein
MPRGKQTADEVDGNLQDIRVYVCAHLAELGPRAKAPLKACFRQRGGDEERRFHWFLQKHEERFTEAQRQHMDATLALLMQHGTAGAGSETAPRSSSKRDLSPVPIGDDVEEPSPPPPEPRTYRRRCRRAIVPTRPDRYRWTADIMALEEQMPCYGPPEVMAFAWRMLLHRLEFMSQSPIPKDVLKAYAKPQTEWWRRAGIVEHPKIPAWCPNGGKQGSTGVKEWHYNLCVVLYADAQAFLVALAAHDRIRQAELRELFGVTTEDSWEEIKRKISECWIPEHGQRRNHASDAAEELLEEAGILPVHGASLRHLAQWDLEHLPASLSPAEAKKCRVLGRSPTEGPLDEA